jgi:hypothetical protein
VNQEEEMSMRRLGFMLVLTFALVASLGATTVAARPDASFRAHASSATQGGTLHVSGKVVHAVRANAFSATAVVHFPTGDVTVTLKRAGHSFHAGARVAVPADAAVGAVAVDVTITYGAITQVVTTNGRIHASHHA